MSQTPGYILKPAVKDNCTQLRAHVEYEYTLTHTTHIIIFETQIKQGTHSLMKAALGIANCSSV